MRKLSLLLGGLLVGLMFGRFYRLQHNDVVHLTPLPTLGEDGNYSPCPYLIKDVE
jgi:hypothetical protein